MFFWSNSNNLVVAGPRLAPKKKKTNNYTCNNFQQFPFIMKENVFKIIPFRFLKDLDVCTSDFLTVVLVLFMIRDNFLLLNPYL